MKILFVLLSFLLSASAMAKIKTESILYKQGDAQLEGYLAYNDALRGTLPGVVIVHEWMGLEENTKKHTRQMAEMGYVAFAADIYGQGIHPKDPKEAGELAGRFKGDRPLLRSRVRAALDTLAAQKRVDSKKLLAMGYCFGGTTVLELARSGAPVIGIVSFHGGLDSLTPADAAHIKGQILVLHGAIDPFVKPEDLSAFLKEMNDHKVDYQFVSYANAVHSFTNPNAGNDPSKGAAYNALADKRSWQHMKFFFQELVSPSH